mgnify:FL=1
MGIIEFFNDIVNLVSKITGINDTNLSQNIVLIILGLLGVAWLAMSLYMLLFEPHLLDNWKYPTVGMISVLLLVGVLSFTVGIMLFTAFFLYVSIGNNSAKGLSLKSFIIFVVK